jgi:hypothetical protein
VGIQVPALGRIGVLPWPDDQRSAVIVPADHMRVILQDDTVGCAAEGSGCSPGARPGHRCRSGRSGGGLKSASTPRCAVGTYSYHRYNGGMTVRKLSISVPPEIEETIKAAAASEGKPVSAWLAEAATEKARAAALHAAGRAAARELVAEYESEHGPLPAASRQRARQFLIETGLIDDEPHRAAG